MLQEYSPTRTNTYIPSSPGCSSFWWIKIGRVLPMWTNGICSYHLKCDLSEQKEQTTTSFDTQDCQTKYVVQSRIHSMYKYDVNLFRDRWLGPPGVPWTHCWEVCALSHVVQSLWLRYSKLSGMLNARLAGLKIIPFYLTQILDSIVDVDYGLEELRPVM